MCAPWVIAMNLGGRDKHGLITGDVNNLLSIGRELDILYGLVKINVVQYHASLEVD